MALETEVVVDEVVKEEEVGQVDSGKEVARETEVVVDEVVKEEATVSISDSKGVKHLLSCSEPSSSALLVALSPVFDLQSIRPVNDMVNFTEVLVSFTLYGILGVVCSV